MSSYQPEHPPRPDLTPEEEEQQERRDDELAPPTRQEPEPDSDEAA
jgi:hypothetical protein